MHYLLFYEKAPDYMKRQAPFEAAHLNYVLDALRRGDMILAGSLAEPTDGAALLLFNCDSSSIAETFAKGDPYVTNGIISHWSVRPWHTLNMEKE
jgi:uncharacterized protein YciI